MNIGPYESDGSEPIGNGGMGSVFRVVQPALGRVVALKVLAAHLEADREALSRFKREALAAAKLHHPNIVTIHDAGTTSSPYYIAMEFLGGGTLADRLGRPLPLSSAMPILAHTAAALDHAHRQGVIHCDVKPANIMFDGEGRAKLTDFGIARVLGQSRATMPGARSGTADYMSPEQAAGSEVDRRSDLYSLGVVLYEMLTGRVPFRNDNPLVTMRQIMDDPVPSPRRLNPSLSEATERALLRALEKDPNKRYQSGGELTQALAGANTGREKRVRSPVFIKVALLVTILAVLGVVIGMVAAPRGPVRDGEKVVPSLKGMTKEQAEEVLKGYRLQIGAVESRSDPKIAASYICGQDPEAGTLITGKLKTVAIFVSSGPPAPTPTQAGEAGGGASSTPPPPPTQPVEVPGLTGLSVRRARQIADGLEVREAGSRWRDDRREGLIYAQDPPKGQKADPGSTVRVWVSLGPRPDPGVEVPGTVGLPLATATRDVSARGLVLRIRGREWSDEYAKDTVCRQQPGPGKRVPTGSTVYVWQSRGRKIIVPSAKAQISKPTAAADQHDGKTSAPKVDVGDIR